MQISNLGKEGRPAISYYSCLSSDTYQNSDCHDLKGNDAAQEVLSSFRATSPNAVVIHDTHWLRLSKEQSFALPTMFQKVLAFNNMANDAANNGADSIFYLTLSPLGGKEGMYSIEMNDFLRTIDTLVCSNNEHSDGVRVSVVDWAKLTCPTIGNAETCSKQAHGFDKILPDDTHPFGESGMWLTRTILAIIIDEITQHDLLDKYDFSPMDNPISKKLLTLAPPDENPALADMISSFYICPYSDSRKLEEHYNTLVFHDYAKYEEDPHSIQ